MENPRQKYKVIKDPQPEAMVVHCNGPNMQLAFAGFIREELKLLPGQYVLFAVAGGAAVLSNPERSPKEFKFLRDRFEFFCKHHPSIKRIVLINHEDCRWIAAKGLPSGKDMRSIAANFNRVLGHLGLEVELYFAEYTDAEKTTVVFEKVSA